MKKNKLFRRYGNIVASIIFGLLFFGWLNSIAFAAQANDLEKVAETDEAVLYVDRDLALLRFESKATGHYRDTKIFNGEMGNAITKNIQKSDLLVTYFTDLVSGAYAADSDYDMAVESGQLEYKPIDNGIKIDYTLKEDKVSIDILPKYVEKQKMYDLVIKNLSDKQIEIFERFYRLYKENYVRIQNENVSELNIKNLKRLFYEVGKYTEEELLIDNETFNIESDTSIVEIKISIEYQLDGGDLVVTVPMDECIISEKTPIKSISVLPYFLSSTTEEDGYMLVPDGSGAIINFNNGRITATNYTSRIYGNDALLGANIYTPELYNSTLPIVGMKWEDYAILAIVEKGGALAELNTEISLKSDEFNKAYFTFHLKVLERVATTSSSSVTTAKYTEDNYKEDIIIRYKVLENEEADYTGMAKAYQDYLISKGVLKKTQHAKDAPLFVELLGSIEKKKFFLGIPYQSNVALTTFKGAKNIINELVKNNITNLQVQYTGWANNGVDHTSLSKIKVERVLGGSKQFENLIHFTKENQIGFFPNINLTGVYSTKNISPRKAFSRFLSGVYSQKADMNHALGIAPIRDNSMYLLSPNYLNTYVAKFMDAVTKYNLSGFASQDIGNSIIADYNKAKGISRDKAIEKVTDGLGSMNDNYSLMLSNPNDYAFPNASYVTNLPVKSNQYNVFNYDVPFTQLVLDGCIEYSAPAINQEVEKDLEELMLQSIETRSNPKFLLMENDGEVLLNTEYTHLFSTTYSDWKEKMIAFYDEYNTFYNQVADATIAKHFVLSDNLRKITYTNGIMVYINYGKEVALYDSYTIGAMDYLIAGKEE